MIEKLEKIAKKIRKEAFDMVINAGKGHMGGSFSCIEILVTLYYGGIFKFNNYYPLWDQRDRFILSKAHSINGLYVILADVGFFDKKELLNYTKNGSLLGGHADNITPGIEIKGGSLGHGLGVGCGMSLAAKINDKKYKTVVIIGDGECQEGSIWESALFANQYSLDNLIVFLDRNGLGSEDFTENTSGINDIEEKWKAFGWNVSVINGHSILDIYNCFNDFYNINNNKPSIIIANTIKGKGMFCLENKPESHHSLPKKEDIKIIRKHLNA